MRWVWLFIFVVAMATAYLLGDRYGAPDPVREVRDRALGRGAEGLAQGEAYARERLAEAAAFSFDDDSLPPPPDLSAAEIEAVLTAFRERAAGALGKDGEEAAPVSAEGDAPDAERARSTAGPTFAASSIDALPLCPRMTISNAPSATDGVVDAPGRVTLRGAALRVNAAPGACLSSSYGQRNGKLHKGIDLHHPDGVPVLAAAAGTVMEAEYRDDYGNTLVLDHGGGAYTRYSHLAGFGPGVRIGAAVADGQRLGLMGNTGGWPMPIHLHFEMLQGDYDTPKKAFGLAPADPFGLPEASAAVRTAGL